MTVTAHDLATFGFTISTFQACTLFYGANGLPVALDGHWGPNTAAAAQHLPHVSPHFDVNADHLRSKGDETCGVRRPLLAALEHLRQARGKPVALVDAYRDPAYNEQIGGAHDSQHMYGLAADPAASNKLTLEFVRGLGIFSGIGVGEKSKHVLHVDVRHLGHNNSTHSTPAHPALWTYPDR